MPASTVISPTADVIVTFLADQGFTAYKWARGDYDLPAGVVELPTIERGLSSQLGSNDWHMSFPVALYFPLEEASSDQETAVGLVEAFVQAVDDNPSLSSPDIVDDAFVTVSEPDFDTGSARPMVVYTCTLELTRLVAS